MKEWGDYMKKISPYILLTSLAIYSSFMLSNVWKVFNIYAILLFMLSTFLLVGHVSKDSKSTALKRIVKSYFLFMIGGATYVLIEILFRNYSHVSMFILGGLCFILIGLLNELIDISLPSQMFLSSIIITGLEYVTGYIVNIKLELNIWDYSNLPYNLNGQICLLFFNLWFLLSIVGILIDDILRTFVFGENFPKYYL